MNAPSGNRASSCLVPAAFDVASVTEAVTGCRERLEGDPDVVVAFASSDYRRHIGELTEIVQIDGHAPLVVGASAEGLFGVGREHEGASGLSLLFLKLPDCRLTLSVSAIPEVGEGTPDGCILLAHPLRTALGAELSALNGQCPGVPVAGGFATGGPEAEDLFLFTQDGVSGESCLALQFEGGVRLEGFTSQGCRPIGEPMVVTAASRNDVLTIGRRKAFAVLEETFGSLGAMERQRADGNVFAGLALTESVDDFSTGHFLIRHIIDADLEAGRLTLDSAARPGQTLQFQLRDAEAAAKEFERACRCARKRAASPFAALLFGGRERGRRLHGVPDRDAEIFQEAFGTLPMAGFFAHGEIGPVADRAFRHDHSVCGAVFSNVPAEVPAEEPGDETS